MLIGGLSVKSPRWERIYRHYGITNKPKNRGLCKTGILVAIEISKRLETA
jgi:hypothetical protein